ncbi:DUF397 domain-containing protein [Nonomuraea sp. CA-143628]|uniref:DUF397 domain-containing protein n=1 Tax=Nonomuraea sp. CA-143628 TaxID=3239997 RepID=UPI003D8B96E5
MQEEIDLTTAEWRKSSLSSATGQCVEVAVADGRIAVRDSKDPQGHHLIFTTGEWRAFVGGVQAGEFDL